MALRIRLYFSRMISRVILSIFILLFDGPPRTSGARLLDTSVSCDQDNFILALNFDSTFRGIVYSEEGFPNCVYVNGSMLSQKAYTLKIPLQGCETKRNSEGNYENAIIVQDNVAYLQSTDKKYLLTCIPSNPDHRFVHFHRNVTIKVFRHDSMITVDFGGVTVENRHTTTEVISATLPPNALMPTANIKYHVEIRAGHGIDALPLSAPLNIGDPISYIVRLEKPVADSQIGRCWATDSKSHLELSNDRGCTVQPKGRIWTNFEKRDSEKETIFVNKIKAWAFPTSNEVNIYCNLRICMSKSCNFGSCSDSSGARWRRDSEGQDGDFDNSTVRVRRNFDISTSDLSEIKTLTMKLRIRRDDIYANFTNSPVEIEDSESTICLSLSHLGLISGCVFAFLILVLLLFFLLFPSKIQKISS